MQHHQKLTQQTPQNSGIVKSMVDAIQQEQVSFHDRWLKSNRESVSE